jgi:hypothetical protein
MIYRDLGAESRAGGRHRDEGGQARVEGPNGILELHALQHSERFSRRVRERHCVEGVESAVAYV